MEEGAGPQALTELDCDIKVRYPVGMEVEKLGRHLDKQATSSMVGSRLEISRISSYARCLKLWG